ncbi:MAG: TonB-dependent receptor [Acidobacteria bacterium]|nr:TonB-dependent receptor [Acidobacteriota bacterium]
MSHKKQRPGIRVSACRLQRFLPECLAALACCLLVRLPAYGEVPLRGMVHDGSGASIANAQVELRSGGWSAAITTDGDGRFTAAPVPAHGTVVVHAEGFAEAKQNWQGTDGTAANIDVVLLPAGAASQVTVTASRTEIPMAQSPASADIVTSEQFHMTAAEELDDALRQVAGFSTYRRTSSRVANPTTEGVSLRGVGSSGASRAAVLLDGVPLNDPFGGWVYWDRVPRESIGQVEVLNGGASALYGSNAMGGVIDLRSRPRNGSYLSAEGDYGSTVTGNGSLAAGAGRGNWAGSVAAEAFTTNGYIVVDKTQRGTVDVPADSSHRAGEASLERKLSSHASLFASGSWFREQRGNGTPLTWNDTDFQQGVLGGNFNSQAAGAFQFRLYGDAEWFHQSFSSVAANRNSEKLSRLQRVPVDELGGSSQWSRAYGARQLLVAGAELHDVRGHSLENAFASGGAASSILDAGGRQRTEGVYGEDVIHASSRLLLTAAARFDWWRNFSAFTNTTVLPSAKTTLDPLAGLAESAVSPRAGANFRVTSRFALTASAYRSFRAPSLNELYRSFRVGNVMTLANSNLQAEHLSGVEAGGVASLGRITARGAFFWNDISQPIANVTLASTASLITRQRQNLGSTRAAGLEARLEARLKRSWMMGAGYQYAEAVVTSFPADSTLVGLWVPEVPRHQLTANVGYANPRFITAALQARIVSRQFDDDRNQFSLEPFTNLDASLSRRLGRGFEVFAAAENLLNQRYSTAKTPIRTIAPPVSARAGLRLTLTAR